MKNKHAMFEDILKSYAAMKDDFEELAQDDFGRSIVNDIYTPIIEELHQFIEIENNINEECTNILSTLNT